MADIFISFSKKHAKLTEELARDLEAEGYTTWWDTSLLPANAVFPQTIRAEIEAAKAVIVIWAEHSVTSRQVYSVARKAGAQGKLLQVRDESLDPRKVPKPFLPGNVTLVACRAKILAALHRRQIVPSNKRRLELETAPPAVAGVKIDAPIGNVLGGWFLPGAGQTEWFKDAELAPEMVAVPSGEFWMGSKDGEGHDSERPRHRVTIPRHFAVGRYPVTFAEWDAALDAGGVKYKPSDNGWGRGQRPVIGVSWDDAQAYVEWLSFKTGKPYRLLSEAEWEYCCRAGTEAAYSFGENPGDLDRHAWHSANSGGKSHPVGGKAANKFGLYDMHGNVWEWCQDCWNDSYKGAPSDGSAWAAVHFSLRVTRGGSCFDVPSSLRSASRARDFADYPEAYAGFRVARAL